MTLWIITVRMDKNPDHNPHNKLTSECPFSKETCTDATGEHHSFIYNAGNEETAHEVESKWNNSYHVTRVEVA